MKVTLVVLSKPSDGRHNERIVSGLALDEERDGQTTSTLLTGERAEPDAEYQLDVVGLSRMIAALTAARDRLSNPPARQVGGALSRR